METCVFKRDWRFYKTCHECPDRKKCERSDKPGWFARIVETVVVGWKRWQIRRSMRKMFKNSTRRDIKNARYNIRRLGKQS